MADKKKTGQPIPSGINSWQIDSARQMHQLTVNARNPPIARRRPVSGAPQGPQASVKTVQATPAPATPAQAAQAQTGAAVSVPAVGHHGRCNNPRCAHCGAVIIPAPAATFPLADTPSISVGSWQIFTERKPILNAGEIERFEEILGIPVPEMIFGNNKVEVVNRDHGFHILFNSLDALKTVSLDPKDLLKVSYANEWFKSREHRHKDDDTVVLEMFKPFDWTYTTHYKGSELGHTGSTSSSPVFTRDDNLEIPVHKLTRRDPILFFDDMTLFEDELGDNGMSTLSCKIRVMPECMLILQRLFVRVDDVMVRIHDTRLYVDFKEGLVVREFKRQQEDYDSILKAASHQSDPRKMLRDIQWCSQQLPVVGIEREYMKLGNP